MKAKATVLLLIVTLLSSFSSSTNSEERGDISYSSFKSQYYELLDSALAKQKRQLVTYLSDVRKKAQNVKRDEFTLTFFKTIHAFQRIKYIEGLPKELIRKTELIEEQYKEHFIMTYHSFYDLLFIDSEGTVFFTIRKQEDYKMNIFEGELKNTALSKKMRTLPSTSFVDFQFYKISREPSAFFIEPVKDEKGRLGWVVLQFAIDKINSMFCLTQEIGETHEVFLVNRNHYMLTDSRFIAESTILKEQLSEKNIAIKFNTGKGHKEVTDYRGQKVCSSFEVFDFMGSKWLIISKMEEAELFTNYFRRYPDKLSKTLKKALSPEKKLYRTGRLRMNSGIEVDMDEFRRGDDDRLLFTHGVSCCTVFVIKKPGDFTYFAHISPLDKVYGKNRTDLLSHMLKRIEYLEVTESEKHMLLFYVASPSSEAFEEIIKRLMEHGYFLSQIKIIHYKPAVYANVSSTSNRKEILVNWKISEDQYFLENSAEREDLRSLIQKTM